jgi:hypothetical protein
LEDVPTPTRPDGCTSKFL